MEAAPATARKVSRKKAQPTKEGLKRPKPTKVSVVRIKYTDPDATDDSSSDETTSSPKQVVHEVHLRKTSPKYPGARLRKWGNWCAEIRNPITKRRQWLGTYPTAEEASRVYLEKKKEFGEFVKNSKEQIKTSPC